MLRAIRGMKTAQTPVTEASIGDTGYRSGRQLWHRWGGTASGRKSGQRGDESPSTGIMNSAMRVPRTGLQSASCCAEQPFNTVVECELFSFAT